MYAISGKMAENVAGFIEKVWCVVNVVYTEYIWTQESVNVRVQRSERGIAARQPAPTIRTNEWIERT